MFIKNKGRNIMDLLILAGGAGSRFGGPKQFEPIDDNGNFIMDYSIFDAVEAGFDRVVLLTNIEYKTLVEETLQKRLAGKVDFEVVYQNKDYAEKKYGIKRDKPLGTGFSILETKGYIKNNFCMINADDFYGKESFKIAFDCLTKLDCQKSDFAIVGYELKNTMSEKGSVKRGICKSENGFITKIIESKAEFADDKIVVRELESEKQYEVEPNILVSMNMLCLTPKIFEHLTVDFEKFCESEDNLRNKELLIPDTLDRLIQDGISKIKLVSTTAKWIGMTYREDKPFVVDGIKELVDKGQYPNNLWNN